MSDDDLTVYLRVALMLWAAIAAMIVWGRYRASRDPNPIPWVYLVTVLAVYACSVFALIVGSHLVVQDWWRPVFSVLNINVIVGSVWVITRAVRYG